MSLPLRAEIYEVMGATPEVRAQDANTTLAVSGNRAAADAGIDVIVRSRAVRVAGQVLAIRNTVTDLVTVRFDGGTRVLGLVALGAASALSPFIAVNAVHAFGDQSATSSGMQVNPTRGRLGAAIATPLTGISAGPAVAAANNQNWTATVALRAFSSLVETFAGSTGVITGAAGYHAEDASIGGATITRLQGMRIEAQTAGVTDNIGIWIEEPTGGATLNDAIHVVAGRSFFGGAVTTSVTLNVNSAIDTGMGFGDPFGLGPGVFLQDAGQEFLAYGPGVAFAVALPAGEQMLFLDNALVAGVVITPDTNNGSTLNVLQAAQAGTPGRSFEVTGAAHTAMTNSEKLDIEFNLSRTVQFTGNAGLALQRAFIITPATYTSDTATKTITTAVTMEITGAPVAGLQVNITTPIAFRVLTGVTSIAGDFAHSGTNLGFYSTAVIAQQAGVAVTAAGVHAACVALGLFTGP